MTGTLETTDPEIADVLQCILGIQAHERRTFYHLIDAPGSTVAELAADLDRDRSSVSRSLSTLEETNLIERERRLLEGGGYVYQYFASPLPEIRAQLHEAIDEWADKAHTLIDAGDTIA